MGMLLSSTIKMTGLAYGYVRASTKEEVEQGSNVRQVKLITDYCKQNDLTVKMFEDKGVSGKTDNRPQLKEMFRQMETDKPEILIVTKIDRLARSSKDLLNMITVLDNKGIKFIAVEQPAINTTTIMGKLMLQIIAAFAEFEVNMINERTRAGREYARARGVKFGRPRNKTAIKNGSIFIDSRKVIELYTQNQMSATAISKLMKCSITPVLRILKDNNIPLRRKGGREVAAPV